jgi:hypothetical protein
VRQARGVADVQKEGCVDDDNKCVAVADVYGERVNASGLKPATYGACRVRVAAAAPRQVHGAMRAARIVSSKNGPQALRSAEAPFRHCLTINPSIQMILYRPSDNPSRSRHRKARAAGSFFRA